jgi:hypothetical protein
MLQLSENKTFRKISRPKTDEVCEKFRIPHNEENG